MVASKEKEKEDLEPVNGDNSKRSCFVVAPIGGDGTDTRRRSDQVLRHVIDPVLGDLNFEPAVRADRITDGGLITRQVIDHILTADLVIADLTDHNPNVFYELALRHAFQKPFVQLVVGKAHVPLPFDVAEQRTIFFDHTDLDDVERAKKTLSDYVKATMEPGADVESPVSHTMDLMTLRGSSNPEDRSQADIIEMLEDIRTAMLRTGRGAESPAPKADVTTMRRCLEELSARGMLSREQVLRLVNGYTSDDHDAWALGLSFFEPRPANATQWSKSEEAAASRQKAKDALRETRQKNALSHGDGATGGL